MTAHQPLEAERALVCAILARPGLLDEVAVEVSTEEFADVETSVVYGSILSLWVDGIPVDNANLVDRMVETGIGPEQARFVVGDLGGFSLDFDNPVSYAHRIRRASKERAFRRRLAELVDDPRPFEEIAAEIAAVAIEHDTRSKIWSARELMAYTIELAQTAQDLVGQGKPPGIMTGLANIDAILGPLYPGEMTAIGAGTSKGKTSLMISMALSMAREHHVGMWSGEDSTATIGPRLNAIVARVPVNRYRAGRLDLLEWKAAVEAAEMISELELYTCFDAGLDAVGVCQRLRIMAIRFGIKVAFVDYLGKIRTSAKDRTAELGQAADMVKATGQQCGFHTVIGSQIPLEAEKATGRDGRPKRPTKHDLKGSGDIGNACENILMIHRPDPNSDAAIVIVDKNKNGPLGDAHVKFAAAYTSFEQPSS